RKCERGGAEAGENGGEKMVSDTLFSAEPGGILRVPRSKKRCLTPFFLRLVEIERAHRLPARDPPDRLGAQLRDAELADLRTRSRLLAERDRVGHDDLVEDRVPDAADGGARQDRM